ncbi:hypothetical protein E2C01_055360 [Portunus trituberculatus]|uniref:Uncharacterized protein n=1 Tax=Portunus trituberculatus TaxID=210409 RepID=A0A5B7GMH9_PORTR|nr:hypothetical protein [Portunus trituberculatus]
MVVAQEAEMEEMAFKIEAEAAQAKIELEGSYLTNNDAVSIEKGMEKQMIRNKPVNQKADVPVHSSVSISPFKSESLRCTDTDTGQHHGDPSKKTTGVASMASARESSKAVAEAPEASHISSDEGEEQLMIMRDSPRWEDEEIQAEESDEPRTIKAEIKLLVKTTEVGKESIEIRSIREFVENENADVISSEGVVQSPAVDSSQLVPGDVQHLQSTSSDLCSPSPKFTRPQVASTYSSICEPTQDEFDLMAQVRVSPTENSSEDHAEIERTSTEISPDSVRFDQDILDTRTEDEAPDLDDDLIPSSPVPGQELNSEEFNRDSLEDEFDRLTADLSSPPKSDKIEFIPKAIGATAPSNDLSFPVSSVVHPPIPPDAFQATQLESGMELTCGSSYVDHHSSQ